MAPKVTGVAVAAGAAYAGSVAFTTLGRPSTSSTVEPRLRGGARPSEEPEYSFGGSTAFVGAMAAGVGAALARRRSAASTPTARAAGTIVDVAVGAGAFTTLVAAVQKAGLVDALSGAGPFTVFAPTDDAFKAFLTKSGLTAEQLLANPDLAKILKHHVVSGKVLAKDVKAGVVTTLAGTNLAIEVGAKGVVVGGATVTKTDVEGSNGVIHIVDSVIVPNTVVDVAVGAGAFTTLVAAVKKAGLVEALSGPGPFTVFAPTDEAFKAFLTKSNLTAEQLLANPDLGKILKHHVVSGNVLAKDVKSGTVTTLAGTSLKIDVGAAVVVGGAKVTTTDVVAGNGIIHIVDAVILP